MNARCGMSDIESEELKATLSLIDLRAAEGSRKGKSREDAALTDEEVAINIQAEDLETLLATLQDHRVAQSIDEADTVTLLALIMVNQGERDDHLAALALSRGDSLPPPTLPQRLLESTEVPSEFGSTSTTDDIDIIGLVEPDLDQKDEGGEPFCLPHHGGQTAAPKRMDCIICGDRTRHSQRLHAPCSHWYCQSCLLNLVEASTWDEKLHPLSCCGQPLPVASVLLFLPLDLRSRFHQKSMEFETPPTLRFYCPNQACSAFLGSSSGRESEITCTNCNTRACSACKNPAHTNENCAENTQTLVVKSLASEMGWQTCPGCRAIVELRQGCYHMTCRCSTQFCYLCAAQWKTCDCRKWDDERLLDEAERLE